MQFFTSITAAAAAATAAAAAAAETIRGKSGAAGILHAGEKHRGSETKMDRENGVHNFRERVPRRKVSGVDTRNQYSVLSEESESKGHFGRLGMQYL